MTPLYIIVSNVESTCRSCLLPGRNTSRSGDSNNHAKTGDGANVNTVQGGMADIDRMKHDAIIDHEIYSNANTAQGRMTDTTKTILLIDTTGDQGN